MLLAAREYCLGAVGSHRHPAQEEAAMAVRPDQKHRRQQPQMAAALQNEECHSQQEVGDQIGPVFDEERGHRGNRERRADGAVKPAAAPVHQKPDNSAQPSQQGLAE